MIENLLDPASLNNYSNYYRTLLSISGVLLGLAFAGLIYVIQDGFSSFKFSRNMFLEYYVKFGQNLLISLAYLTIIPISALYLSIYPSLLSSLFYLFAFFFIKTLMDYYNQLGYIHTIFSEKFVPQNYGSVRSYFHFIRNLGFFRNLLLLFSIIIFVLYPVAISFYSNRSFQLTSKGLFYSTLLILLYSIYRIINFLPNLFKYTQLEIQSGSIQSNESKEDFTKEKQALKKYLESHELKELNPFETKEFLDGELRLNFFDKRKGEEAWFNIHINTSNSNVFEIHDSVCRYAYEILSLLNKSQVDINTFVLSFHINIDDMKPQTMFFRTTRS
ncbi:hypothetical protein [Rhodohalobacter sp. 614A]|uniref:hypothetical protein n=1 Tax=Rhodohalobacter sp. 614A TaxID=2908649 RepID=UPI001F3284A1|nr:hypothetical protein [Rhodohalobacter sp. 614A]